MAPSAMKKKARCKLAVREAYRRFADYYARDAREAAAVPADYLAVPSADGVQPRTAPIPVTEVPCVQMLSAGVAIMEDRPKLPSTGLTAEALRLAGAEGVRLRGLELNGTKAARRSLPLIFLSCLSRASDRPDRRHQRRAHCSSHHRYQYRRGVCRRQAMAGPSK